MTVTINLILTSCYSPSTTVNTLALYTTLSTEYVPGQHQTPHLEYSTAVSSSVGWPSHTGTVQSGTTLTLWPSCRCLCHCQSLSRARGSSVLSGTGTSLSQALSQLVLGRVIPLVPARSPILYITWCCSSDLAAANLSALYRTWSMAMAMSEKNHHQ